MKFSLDLKIFIFVILFLITNQVKIYAMIMIFAIIHELGDLIAGLILGMKPEKMEIKPFGVTIQFQIKREDYMIKIKKANFLEVKKIFVALAGPITNVVLIMLLILSNIFNEYDKMIMIFSNVTLIIFNLLPIYPLDGGRILKGIIYIIKGIQIAEKYIYYISYITLIMITMVSSISILYLENIAIFLAVIYLWGIQIKEHRIYENRKILYDTIEKEMKKYDYENIEIPIENKVN